MFSGRWVNIKINKNRECINYLLASLLVVLRSLFGGICKLLVWKRDLWQPNRRSQWTGGKACEGVQKLRSVEGGSQSWIEVRVQILLQVWGRQQLLHSWIQSHPHQVVQKWKGEKMINIFVSLMWMKMACTMKWNWIQVITCPPRCKLMSSTVGVPSRTSKDWTYGGFPSLSTDNWYDPGTRMRQNSPRGDVLVPKSRPMMLTLTPATGFPAPSLTTPLTPRWACPIYFNKASLLSSQNCGNSLALGYLQHETSSVTSMHPCHT